MNGSTKLHACHLDTICVYCGIEHPRLTDDHVVPLSEGGADDASNIVPACSWCNYAKLNLTPSQWLVELAYSDVCGTLRNRSDQMVLDRLGDLIALGLIDEEEHQGSLRARLGAIQARLARHLQ